MLRCLLHSFASQIKINPLKKSIMWKIKKNKGQIAFNAERVLMTAKAPLDSVFT